MFESHRQARLNPILSALRAVPAVVKVEQDDFDSYMIQVVLCLDDCQSRSGSFDGHKPFRFAASIATIKARIREVLKQAKVNYDFVSWPTLKYIKQGGRNIKDGYCQDYIKLNVYV